MSKLIRLLICTYQKFFSAFFGHRCRFYPSCSEYAKQSFEWNGILIGLYATVNRILRCHPWHPGGYDPVKMRVFKGSFQIWKKDFF